MVVSIAVFNVELMSPVVPTVKMYCLVELELTDEKIVVPTV